MRKQENKDFDIFVGNLLSSYREFSYWYFITESFRNNEDVKNKTFWLTTRTSFLKSCMSGLAKTFEKQNGRFPDVLSIYYLLDIQFAGFEDTLNKLKDVRDKILMHSEVETLRDIDFFYEKNRTNSQHDSRLICKGN